MLLNPLNEILWKRVLGSLLRVDNAFVSLSNPNSSLSLVRIPSRLLAAHGSRQHVMAAVAQR